MKYLMKIFFVVVFTSLTNAMYAQPQFVNYEDFETDIERGVDIKTLNGKYNLTNILKLDTTYSAQIFKVYPGIKEEMSYSSNSSSYLKPNTIIIRTYGENLKEFLKSERLINLINEKHQVLKLRLSPVYIKDNRVALVDFSGECYGGQYLFRVQNGKIYGYLIYTIQSTPVIEDKSENQIISFAEVMPTFQGGNLVYFRDWLKNHRSLAYLKNSSKIFVATFVIKKDGSIGDIKMLDTSKIDDSARKDVIHVIEQSPRWTPALHNDQPIDICRPIYIKF